MARKQDQNRAPLAIAAKTAWGGPETRHYENAAPDAGQADSL